MYSIIIICSIRNDELSYVCMDGMKQIIAAKISVSIELPRIDNRSDRVKETRDIYLTLTISFEQRRFFIRVILLRDTCS